MVPTSLNSPALFGSRIMLAISGADSWEQMAGGRWRAAVTCLVGQALFPDELHEVLAKHEHPCADLVKWQALAPEHSPCRLPNAKAPLQFWERVEFVGPDEPREEF